MEKMKKTEIGKIGKELTFGQMGFRFGIFFLLVNLAIIAITVFTRSEMGERTMTTERISRSTDVAIPAPKQEVGSSQKTSSIVTFTLRPRLGTGNETNNNLEKKSNSRLSQ